MDGIRVALFGLTHPHSLGHLKTLQASDLVKGIVLFDDDARVVADVRERMGNKVQGGYVDLDEMFAGESFQVGVADFRNHLNGALCLRLIDKGVHVISEKPVTNCAEELSRIVDAASREGVKLGVMYQNRYHPVAREARRLVADGVIGRVTGCEARMITSQVRFRNPGHWLFDCRQAGGGILSWLGCHYIDLLRYVLDDDVVEVSAIADTLSGEDIDVEDVASLALRFGKGAIGSLHAGYQLAMSIPGYSGATYDTYVGFRGTEGRVYWNPVDRPPVLHAESTTVGWRSSPVRSFHYALPELDCYGGAFGLAFLERFLYSVNGDGEPPATGEDALRVARIIEAAYASSETGRRIEITS
ncbi:MAG: Gfo/Idh/MocA family oxidoreductase [Gemmatimonadota bacterium]|nr:Gfo/Idh/MocA family oxidoreductase [Gemmatimonadota bacterium]